MSPEAFKTEVWRWAELTKTEPTQVRVQRMTRKWASCSTSGCLSFSKELLQQRKEFRDYVIVHELLHLKVPNHGKLFKRLLDAFVPGWERLPEVRR
ncbi:M48 family metallopeptidase [Haloferula sp. A504]|uniref:M48 family metallopeptidase n=1 Tax=Haloferula sp. A504 TaxID=3373601 RepID=UPI0031C227F7|nr:M48 family metallopeptidase [Verrucomicrobiaceae bacterium E54]